MTRFRVDDAHEVLRDPDGHFHHWTILAGVLLEGTLRVSDAYAIPRVGGGHWFGSVVGFMRLPMVPGKMEDLGPSMDAAEAAGQMLGVAISGVAPPRGTVAPGEAHSLTLDESRILATEVFQRDPEVCKHCRDCTRILRFIGRPC